MFHWYSLTRHATSDFPFDCKLQSEPIDYPILSLDIADRSTTIVKIRLTTIAKAIFTDHALTYTKGEHVEILPQTIWGSTRKASGCEYTLSIGSVYENRLSCYLTDVTHGVLAFVVSMMIHDMKPFERFIEQSHAYVGTFNQCERCLHHEWYQPSDINQRLMETMERMLCCWSKLMPSDQLISYNPYIICKALDDTGMRKKGALGLLDIIKRLPVTADRDYLYVNHTSLNSSWSSVGFTGKDDRILALSPKSIAVFERLSVLCDELIVRIGDKDCSAIFTHRPPKWSTKLTEEKEILDAIINRLQTEDPFTITANSKRSTSFVQTEPIKRFSITTTETVSVEPEIVKRTSVDQTTNRVRWLF